MAIIADKLCTTILTVFVIAREVRKIVKIT